MSKCNVRLVYIDRLRNRFLAAVLARPCFIAWVTGLSMKLFNHFFTGYSDFLSAMTIFVSSVIQGKTLNLLNQNDYLALPVFVSESLCENLTWLVTSIVFKIRSQHTSRELEKEVTLTTTLGPK